MSLGKTQLVYYLQHLLHQSCCRIARYWTVKHQSVNHPPNSTAGVLQPSHSDTISQSSHLLLQEYCCLSIAGTNRTIIQSSSKPTPGCQILNCSVVDLDYLIEYGSGSSISSESKSGFGSRVFMSKDWKKITAEIFFFFLFWSKIAIYLSLGLHKGRPSYRRSLQPSKENIHHFKWWIY